MVGEAEGEDFHVSLNLILNAIVFLLQRVAILIASNRFIHSFIVLSIMTSFATENNVYQNVSLSTSELEGVFLKARVQRNNQPSLDALLYGTPLSSSMYERISQLHPSVAYPVVGHPSFITLLQPPFISIVPLPGTQPTFYYLLAFEHSTTTPLYNHIAKLSNHAVLQHLLEIVSGLEYLRTHYDHIHGELNPQTIFVNRRKSKSQEIKFKMMPPRPRVIREIERHCSHIKSSYKSPQFFQSYQSSESDVWSLGLIAFELLKGKRLKTIEHQRAQTLHQQIGAKRLAEVVGRMLRVDFKQRIKVEELKLIIEQLSKQALQGIKFMLPLVNHQSENGGGSVDCEGEEQRRVILNSFLLSLIYSHQEDSLRVRLLFKSSLQQFISVTYHWSELPISLSSRWPSLRSLMLELSIKNKAQIRFLTDGNLSFTAQDPHLINDK